MSIVQQAPRAATPDVSREARPAARHTRSLLASKWLWLALIAVGGVVAVAATPSLRTSGGAYRQTPMVHTVARGFFAHDVTEPGEVESANNLEIRCEVKSRNTTGTTILEIIPNGTAVEKGTLLIRFDASALENERAQQQIACNTSLAAMVTAKRVFETAKITKREYLEGTYKQEEQTVQSEVFVAEENLRRAEEYAQYSERLAAKGYVTALQVEADRFAVEKARKEKESAATKLKVLQNFTKEKMVTQLDADVVIAEAKLKSDEGTHQIDTANLATIEAQIAKCRVVAPQSGTVVYAKGDRRNNTETVIEEGAVIRENQPVLRLPDLTDMKVLAKINESRITFVKPGMPAIVRLDAVPDVELAGIVKRVDEFPLPSNWFSSSIKQYGAHIEIYDHHPDLRPGMTAQVQISVKQVPDAITVPVQAVIERNNKFFCLIETPDGAVVRPIDIGSSNNDFLIVNSGLAVGEQVLINPDKFLGEVEESLSALGGPKAPTYRGAEMAGKNGPDGEGPRTGGGPGSRGAANGENAAPGSVGGGEAGAGGERPSRRGKRGGRSGPPMGESAS